MAKKKKTTKKRVYQNIKGWYKDRGDYVITGLISFTPEFLEELLTRFDEGDDAVIDDYREDDVRVKVLFTLREGDRDDVYGSVFIAEPRDDDDDDDDDTSRKKRRSRR